MRPFFHRFVLACFLPWQANAATADDSEGANLVNPAQQNADAFVVAKGAHFELAGRPFYFQGTNFYRLSLIEKQSDSQVYDIMQQLAAKGIRTVRTWGFACGHSNARAIIKSVTKDHTEYDETALQRLDLTMDAARNAGVKIILPLVNFQQEYCSMGWWVKQITGLEDPQLFYTHPDIRAAFKRHIAMLLTRTNTVYQSKHGEHRTYAEDPTIMAMELANEPHTDDFYELKHNLHPGDLLYNWLREMSDYIRSMDRNHLIASGEEGYKIAPTTPEEGAHHGWLSNGMKGADYARNLTLPNISFATVHAYPTNWAIPASDLAWFGEHYLHDRSILAHNIQKPVVLEETGFSAFNNPDLGYTTDPARWLEQLYTSANDADYAGTMIWELVPTGSEEGDFIFDFTSPVASVVFSQAHLMNERTF